MTISRIAAIGTLLLAGCLWAPSTQAASLSDCSAQYRSAQAAGTLGGMRWNDFIKTRCTAPGSAPSLSVASGQPSGGAEIIKAAATTRPVAPEGVVFPKAIDPKFAGQTPTQARMHTCLAQYKIDKANNGLKGLKWIQAGGGYYSICNAQLKG